ncbi:hypothetical protein Hanom_Chr03g00185901 [Helianthus anomalus]
MWPSGPIPTNIRSSLANPVVGDFFRVPLDTNCLRRCSYSSAASSGDKFSLMGYMLDLGIGT